MTNEPASTISSVPSSDAKTDSVHAENRITTVAWLVGISAVVGFCTISEHATIGEGLGYAGIAGMVTIVSCFILKK